MIERLILFGATGDLMGRFLLPALAELHDAGKLPPNFQVVATARRDWDDAKFRSYAAQKLQQHAAPDVLQAAREGVVRSLRFLLSDFSDADSIAALVKAAIDHGAKPVAAYLALPSTAFTPAVRG